MQLIILEKQELVKDFGWGHNLIKKKHGSKDFGKPFSINRYFYVVCRLIG